SVSASASASASDPVTRTAFRRRCRRGRRRSRARPLRGPRSVLSLSLFRLDLRPCGYPQNERSDGDADERDDDGPGGLTVREDEPGARDRDAHGEDDDREDLHAHGERAVSLPVGDDRAEEAALEEERVEALRGEAEEPRGEEDEGRGRKNRKPDPEHREAERA